MSPFIERHIPWNKGKRLSKKTIKKIKIARAKQRITQEHIKKQRESRRKNGWWKNPKETRERIRLSHLGKKHSKKTKNKIRLAHLGKKLTEEHKRKIGESEKREKHHNWLGGKSFEPYGLEFNNKFKRAIRKRDNQVCMLCGIHKEKLGCSLSVHHINYNKKLNIPQNCISLCRSCHMKTSYKRKYWIRFFQSLLKDIYNYQYNNGRIVINLMNKK